MEREGLALEVCDGLSDPHVLLGVLEKVFDMLLEAWW